MPGHWESHYICKGCGGRFSSMNNKTKGEREICPKCKQGKVDPTYEASIDNYIFNLLFYIAIALNCIKKIFLIKIFDHFSFVSFASQNIKLNEMM